MCIAQRILGILNDCSGAPVKSTSQKELDIAFEEIPKLPKYKSNVVKVFICTLRV